MGMKWTAFLRLTGEAETKNRNKLSPEILGVLLFLQGISAQYDLIVLCEDEGSRVFHPLNSEQSWEAWAHDEESGI